MTPAQRAGIVDQIAERTARLQLLVRKLLTASSIDAAGVRPLLGRTPVLVGRTPVLAVIVEQLADINTKPGKSRYRAVPA